jgi:8-oxo-dGTP pyrophosphatase MutT (NUDIX family)
MKIQNPQSAAIEELAGEAPIDPAHLNLDWIRNRFVLAPAWQPELTDEHRFALTGQSFKDASVLIALVQREHGLNLLFTRRTAHLSHHAGQISFPGGRAEPDDADAIETALRETQEEIGLDRSRVEILGQLPYYHTITGYRVTPVVAAVVEPGQFKSDQNEVAEIFEVPLEFLMNGSAHQRRSLTMTTPENQAIRRSFYAMPYQDYFIWGATAGMLRNLYHFLRA